MVKRLLILPLASQLVGVGCASVSMTVTGALSAAFTFVQAQSNEANLLPA